MFLFNCKWPIEGKEKLMSLPQGKEKFECVCSYMMLKLIQIMVYD